MKKTLSQIGVIIAVSTIQFYSVHGMKMPGGDATNKSQLEAKTNVMDGNVGNLNKAWKALREEARALDQQQRRLEEELEASRKNLATSAQALENKQREHEEVLKKLEDEQRAHAETQKARNADRTRSAKAVADLRKIHESEKNALQESHKAEEKAKIASLLEDCKAVNNSLIQIKPSIENVTARASIARVISNIQMLCSGLGDLENDQNDLAGE